jgi:ketosteroid isomerase-like protein
MGDAETLRGMLDDWAAGVRARDAAAVVRGHAGDILTFDVVGPVAERGLDAYRRGWVEQFFPWHGGTGRFALRDVAVTAGGDVGFATALIDCAGTEGGRPVAFTLRLTVGFERRDGAWLVVHEHHSEPLPLPTEAGAFPVT